MSIQISHSTETKAVDRLPSLDEDCPSVVESEISSICSAPVPDVIEPQVAAKRLPLQWEFKGLTLWLEYEEFESDLTRANEFLSSKYGTEQIPTMHSTAIYGMEHIDEKDAMERLSKIKEVLPGGKWPLMEPPVAVKSDLAEEGKPGQVCTIAWAELTLRSNEDHELAMDALCKLFDVDRQGPWTPHISLAYDNPKDSVLNLADIITYAMVIPSLLRNRRQVKAISLWNTEGKMGDWMCLDRVSLLND